jgi:predicted RecB family nuclease
MKQNKVRQHTIYKNKDGKRLCGVTTITGLLSKPQLLAWANRIGLEGLKMDAYVDDLASVGTLAHAMIISHLTGEKLDTNEYSKNDINRAENAMISFLEWHKNNPVEVVLSEQPLISEKYQFGGTPDIYGTLNGQRVIIDLKTGSGLYPDYSLQVTGYKILLEENGHQVDKAILLRVGRDESEGFETKELTQFAPYEKIFTNLLEIRELKNKVNWR